MPPILAGNLAPILTAPALGNASMIGATDNLARLTLRLIDQGHDQFSDAYQLLQTSAASSPQIAGEIIQSVLADPALKRFHREASLCFERLRLVSEADRRLSADLSRRGSEVRPNSSHQKPELQPERIDLESQEGGEVEETNPASQETPVDLETDALGLTLRDYQEAYFHAVIGSIQSGADRGLIRDPWQVGKTFVIGPLAQAAAQFFPGKKTLVIVPYKIIKDQILADLRSTFPGKVGVIDGNHKDFSGEHDLILASAYTLGKPNHLKKLNPKEFGFVVVDEATFARAKMWRNILRHLGFLDPQGFLQKTTGKYLLGLTADQVSLLPIFGADTPIVSHGLPWFINKGYLHRVHGMRLQYEDVIPMERTIIEGEEVLVPVASKAFDDVIVRVYIDRFIGKRVMVNVATIEHAERLARVFNNRLGLGAAAAVHSGMTDEEVRRVVQSYERENGPRILVSIGKLSHGYRARGTAGVINTFERGSLRRYGQQIGRPLGRSEGEPQRTILVIDMQGKGRPLSHPASLPRLFGIPDYAEAGKILDPLKDRPGHGGKPSLQVQAVRGGKGGFLRFEYVRTGDKVIQPILFPNLIRQALKRYDGDPGLMARDLGIGLDTLDRFLYGEMPRTIAQARALAAKVGPALEGAWRRDSFRILSELYPIDDSVDTATRKLIQWMRMATLLLGKGPVWSVFTDAPGKNAIHRFFKGEKTALGPATLRSLQDAIVASGVATPEEVRLLLGEKGIVPIDDAYDMEVIPVEGSDPSDGRFAAQALQGIHLLVDDPIPSPEEFTDLFERGRDIRMVLNQLTPMEQGTLLLRFGLESTDTKYDDDYTLDEVGARWGFGREGIRIVEKHGLDKLRHPNRRKLLEEFYHEDTDYYAAGLLKTALQMKEPPRISTKLLFRFLAGLIAASRIKGSTRFKEVTPRQRATLVHLAEASLARLTYGTEATFKAMVRIWQAIVSPKPFEFICYEASAPITANARALYEAEKMLERPV